MSLKLSNNNYKVYKHTVPNGKVYIGITHQNVLSRWAGGFGYQTQIYFWRAIVKYGWINIKHEILYENLSKEDAQKKEIELIKKYNSQDYKYGYNIDMGSDHLASEDNRRKASEAKKGKKWSERRRLASLEYFEHFQGRTVYKYDKEGKLIEVFKTVAGAARDAKVSVETLRSRLKNNKKMPTYDYYYSYGKFENIGEPYKSNNYHMAAVDMYDMSMNHIKTFKSISEAGRFLGTGGTKHISDVCKGKRLSSNGYIWRYHNENKDNKIA